MPDALTPTPSREDFDAGRDLAMAYIKAAIRETGNPPTETHCYYPAGVLRPFLDRLQAQPELVHGFDACLTAVLAAMEHGTPNVDDPWLTHQAVYGPEFERLDA